MFVFLVPILFCLVYVIKKMLFITKIKQWRILEKAATPENTVNNIEGHSSRSRSSFQQRSASQLLSQIPRLNQVTSVLVSENLNE